MTTVFQRVRVGPYEIVHEIGRGGMAIVFLATDSRDGRSVALKLVPTGTDREAREVLEAERWGAKLQEQFCRVSRNVPEVYAHDTEGAIFLHRDGVPRGRNLSEVIGDGPLAPERAAGLAIQLCQFLEAAHGFEATIDGRHLRSLLHGDLKPRNIRVLDGDRIKVLDFGIAKALSLSRKVTRNDFGSIAYLSPERLESGEIDAARRLLGGGRPALCENGGRRPTVSCSGHAPVGAAHRSLRPAAPLDAAVSPGLQAIVAKLLAGDAADRYRDAAAIRADLECFAAGATTQAQREGWPARAQDEPGHAARRLLPARSRRKRPAGRSERRRTCNPPRFRRRRRSLRPSAAARETAAPVPRCTSADSAAAAGARHRRQRAVAWLPRRGASRPGCRWWNSTASAGSGISATRSTPAAA